MESERGLPSPISEVAGSHRNTCYLQPMARSYALNCCY